MCEDQHHHYNHHNNHHHHNYHHHQLAFGTGNFFFFVLGEFVVQGCTVYGEGGGRAELANPCKERHKTGLSYLRPAVQLNHWAVAVEAERSTQLSLTDRHFQVWLWFSYPFCLCRQCKYFCVYFDVQVLKDTLSLMSLRKATLMAWSVEVAGLRWELQSIERLIEDLL